MNEETLKKIVEGKFDSEVIDAIKNTDRYVLYVELVRYMPKHRNDMDSILYSIVGDAEVNMILERALDSAGLKYTLCEETKKIITYLDLEEHIARYDRLRFNGSNYLESEETNDAIYRCPHCGKAIKVSNFGEAIEVIKGERDESGRKRD